MSPLSRRADSATLSPLQRLPADPIARHPPYVLAKQSMSRAHKVNISKGRRKLSAYRRQYTRRHDWAGRSKEESLFSQFYLRICRLGGALDILAEVWLG